MSRAVVSGHDHRTTAVCVVCGANADGQPQELGAIWAEAHVEATGHPVTVTIVSTAVYTPRKAAP